MMIGCGPQTARPDPASFLEVGVDPALEADAIQARFSASGYALVRRMEGQTFVALTARKDDTRLLRVLTRRGVVLAAQSPGNGRTEVGLVPLQARDLDDDGQEELVVYADDPLYSRRCHAILRIHEDGAVQEITPSLDALLADSCIENIVPTPRGFTAMAVARYAHLSRGTTPELQVPYDSPSWRRRRQPNYWREEQLHRRTALAEADDGARYRLGVELALLSWLRGDSAEEQTAAFDNALAGGSWSEEDLAAFQQLRELISHQWQSP